MSEPMQATLYRLATNIVTHVQAMRPQLDAGQAGEQAVTTMVQDILAHTLTAEGFVRIERPLEGK